MLGKPSEIVCKVCGHANDVLDVVVMINQETGGSVLYIAERNRNHPHLATEFQALVRENSASSACVIAENGREFRRACATLFLEPHMRTFNEGNGSDDLGAWARTNSDRLGPGFMAAMWLLLNGALPMGAQQRTELAGTLDAQSFFRPSAENEASFSRENLSLIHI